MRNGEIGAFASPVAGGGRGAAVIAEAIFGKGPLLPKIS